VLHYIGRLDHQIQVGGHRVELGEIEAALRAASGIGEVVAVGWPLTESGAAGVVAFLAADESLDRAALRSKLAATLPTYMIPRDVHVLPELPRNANGKFDRRALLAELEQR
jgi:acyl-coenzyme A synthetase/AMP-(fatty) acid ligase